MLPQQIANVRQMLINLFFLSFEGHQIDYIKMKEEAPDKINCTEAS